MGIHQRLSAEKVELMYVPLDYLPDGEDALQSGMWVHDLLDQQQPDLLLVYGGGLSYTAGNEALRCVLERYHGVPIINMGSHLEGYPTIEVDNYGGMRKLMRELLQRRPEASLMFLSGPPLNEDSRLRRQALEDELAEQGRVLTEAQVLPGDFTAHVAEKIFAEYLERTEQPADIVVCANDISAKGVLDAISASQWSCPERIWVTGYDDFEYAAFVMPGLTTVHFPAADLGRTAAEAGLQLLAGRRIATTQTVQGFPVYRGTTGDDHPGIGDHQKNLLAQWELLQQRDNNSRKIKVLRNVNRKQPLQDLLVGLAPALNDLSVDHLSVLTQTISEGGAVEYTEYTSKGLIRRTVASQRLFPKEFSRAPDDGYWVLCPLSAERLNYGFIVAHCAPESAEFIEFLAPQLAELLHTEALEERNENYRVQNELNERMASLGSLVSGVAHEANTPIGNGKLAASAMLDVITQVKAEIAANRLTRGAFDQFIADTDEYAQIIYQSLDRAAKLISNFKMVSVDQTAEEKRTFDLGQYIDSVLLSLRHQLKGTSVQLLTDLPEGILVDTFPGAVAQVVTNLFMNALKHGFSNGSEAGTIHFVLVSTSTGFRLTISDDGAGAGEQVLNHIFDPFFTTTRGKGGSGLGMHIVFNLLSQKLNWSIALESSPGQGMNIVLEPNVPAP